MPRPQLAPPPWVAGQAVGQHLPVAGDAMALDVVRDLARLDFEDFIDAFRRAGGADVEARHTVPQVSPRAAG